MQLHEAKRLQAHLTISGFQQQELSLRKLITFFAISNPSSTISYAHKLFDQIENPSTYICNIMIRAYGSCSDPVQALNLYTQMHKHGPSPDNYTFPFLLKACSILTDLRKGKEIHCQVIKHGFESDIFVQNSLIHLYGSNDDLTTAHRIFDQMGRRDIASWTTLVACYANYASIVEARRLFDEMPKRSIVSYSAMIAGYVRRSRFVEALELFRELQIGKLEPNDSTVMSVISACANLGALGMGRWIHSFVQERQGIRFDSRIATALIDMYFKCGSVKNALHVFEGVKAKYVGEWTAMISGMAMHGHGERAIELFEDMVKSGIKPNVVTFVAVLSGCTHAGLVCEGLKYFERMKNGFGIDPTIEHFGCVVDLLGRAGRIDQAVEFIQVMPVKANAVIWSALLNACRVHTNVGVGEWAARRTIEEEPWNGAVYMGLLGLYREAGRWDDVEKLKREMKGVGCRKNPGCSLIEVNGVCYEFVAGDKSYPCVLELCLNLSRLVMEVKKHKWIFA